YIWDVNLRLKAIKDVKGIKEFEHTTRRFLAKTTFENGEVQLKNPDPVGNLYKTAERKDRVYAPGGKLQKMNGWQFSYNDEGKLVEKKHIIHGQTWQFIWNDVNMLTKVIRPDGEEVSFTYDVLGRRLTKQIRKTITRFAWDGNVLIHEWKQHADTGEKLSDLEVGKNGLVTWIWDDKLTPAAKFKGNKKYSVVTDHLGTPVQMFNENGELIWDCELDSYGNVRMETGEAGSCPFRYPGQYCDAETDLCFNHFRYYSPEMGAYISPDPIGLMGGLRLYSYVPDTNIFTDRPGLIPAYGVAGYGTDAHSGDGLEAHELLQNAHLKQ